jgi:hypothetical protein
LRYQISIMKSKNLLSLVIALLAIGASGQNRVFSYSQVQSRNSLQEWGKVQNISERRVYFTPEEIDMSIDKKYHLTIVSKTDLPDNGIIYLCNDEKSNPVTVMLIDNSKMYVYSKSKRYLINFDPMKPSVAVADND